MKLYLQTYCSNEHWNPCAPIVVAELDDTQLQQLREVRDELVRLKEKHGATAILVDGFIEAWDRGFYEEGEEFSYKEAEYLLRTECDRIVVNDDGFLFRAYVDDCPEELTTEEVRFDQIEIFATPPWKR